MLVRGVEKLDKIEKLDNSIFFKGIFHDIFKGFENQNWQKIRVIYTLKTAPKLAKNDQNNLLIYKSKK